LGWSGDRSKALAEALRDWLPLVLHYLEPWMSTVDIAAGKRWSTDLATELEASNFGIITVTPENVSEPWILFEAGSLAKSLHESKVVPLLLNLELSEVTGPISQFQAKKADKSGIRAVVDSINKSAPEPLGDARKGHLFEALWSTLSDKLSAIPEVQQSSKSKRPHLDVLEELVASVRSFDSRLRSIEEVGSGIDSRSRSGRRFHPNMVWELIHMSGFRRSDPTRLLVIASLLREDAPWLYEVMMDSYSEAIHGGRRSSVAYHRLVDFMNKTQHVQMMEELVKSKETSMLIDELQQFLKQIPENHEDLAGLELDVKPPVFINRQEDNPEWFQWPGLYCSSPNCRRLLVQQREIIGDAPGTAELESVESLFDRISTRCHKCNVLLKTP